MSVTLMYESSPYLVFINLSPAFCISVTYEAKGMRFSTKESSFRISEDFSLRLVSSRKKSRSFRSLLMTSLYWLKEPLSLMVSSGVSFLQSHLRPLSILDNLLFFLTPDSRLLTPDLLRLCQASFPFMIPDSRESLGIHSLNSAGILLKQGDMRNLEKEG